jgi:hypothetical protein
MTTDDTVPRDEPIRAMMDLLREMRTRRAGKGRKSPFQPTLYTRVGGLVRRYALDERFVRALDDAPGLPRDDEPRTIRQKRKEPYEAPLFFLSTEEEHGVTLAILAAVTNPYLQYVTSPDEILLCAELFRRNPSLSPETLSCHHFETLMPAGEDAGPG